MLRGYLRGPILVTALLVPLASQVPAPWKDPSPHAVRFVKVEKDVALEVLDWGGSGRPVVLLAGGGNTAHVFDDFAPKLTPDYHVYGVTRRGFGASGFAPSQNALDRLRDDLLAVMDALRLERPVLVGHSIGGAELSAVAADRPDRIVGMIYLEAAYPYAFNDGNGPEMREFQDTGRPQPPSSTASDLAGFRALQKWDARLYGFRTPEAELRQARDSTASGGVGKARDVPGSKVLAAILSGGKRFTQIPVPALVVFALPHVPDQWMAQSADPTVQAAAKSYFTKIDALTERQAKSLEAAVPTARVIRLGGAHYIFLSNEPEVLREMRAFIDGLK